MAFDFPSSPTLGQTFTPAGGLTYTWNGYAWTVSGGVIGGGGSGGAEPQFASGSTFVMQQASAPTGYTKGATHNDKSLRVVSGTPGSGGTLAFSTVFGRTATDAHALSVAELAPHGHNLLVAWGSGGTQAAPNMVSAPSDYAGVNDASNPLVQNTGGGSAHTHPIDIRVQYVDVILAVKT